MRRPIVGLIQRALKPCSERTFVYLPDNSVFSSLGGESRMACCCGAACGGDCISPDTAYSLALRCRPKRHARQRRERRPCTRAEIVKYFQSVCFRVVATHRPYTVVRSRYKRARAWPTRLFRSNSTGGPSREKADVGKPIGHGSVSCAGAHPWIRAAIAPRRVAQNRSVSRDAACAGASLVEQR